MNPGLSTGRCQGLVLRLLLLISFAIILAPGQVHAQQTDREKAVQMIKTASGLSEEGETDKALALVREAIGISSDYAEAHDLLGSLLIKKGLFEEALKAFSEALKINPKLRTAKTGMGLALLGKGDIGGAETTLKNALVLNPYPAMAHYALGLLYQKTNADDKAAFHFGEGLRTFKEGKK